MTMNIMGARGTLETQTTVQALLAVGAISFENVKWLKKRDLAANLEAVGPEVKLHKGTK